MSESTVNIDPVLSKLNTLLGARSTNDLYGVRPVYNEEEDIFDRMFEFIISLDPEQLTEEQASEVMDIVEDIELIYEDINEDEEYDDVLDEATPKRVRINRAARRKRKMLYRKKKAKLRRMAKRYRKSARGRMMAKKAKRMKRRGKTATGRRIRRFV